MFDLGDRVECSLFLAAMRGDKTATGVLLVPVAVSSATPALGQLARRIPSELRTEPLPTSGNLGRRRMVWTDPERRRAGPVWGGLVGDWRATQVSVSLSDPRRRLFERLTVGESVFLTRPPGCCKTHIVREVKGALVEAGLCVAACGSSGVAAALIDGLTVHSWAGFRNGDNDVSSILRVVLDKVIPDTAKSRMALAMVLVVDEVSTLSAELITRLDEVLRDVRGRQAAFGGLAVLVSGDFLQTCSPRGRYALNSKVWTRARLATTPWCSTPTTGTSTTLPTSACCFACASACTPPRTWTCSPADAPLTHPPTEPSSFAAHSTFCARIPPRWRNYRGLKRSSTRWTQPWLPT